MLKGAATNSPLALWICLEQVAPSGECTRDTFMNMQNLQIKLYSGSFAHSVDQCQLVLQATEQGGFWQATIQTHVQLCCT